LSTIEVIKPVIRPSKNISEVSINFSFVTGPERKTKTVAVDGEEYAEIIDRILQDDTLIEEIIECWREYASALIENGKNAPPPIRGYHRKLMLACDPKDQNRAATLSTVFGEKIESDALYQYMLMNNPAWASEFSIQEGS
jgi:predicted phage-related endonuclease